ncbi:MAG: hypothetical protein S4CHLAM123_11630 [Chlamydiales bacterium]|nr:hypothetical protein [Chlamydiales bacterium]
MANPLVASSDYADFDLGHGEDPVETSSTFCGRKVNPFSCLDSKVIFTVSGIAGSVLLLIGVLALIGSFAPASTALAAITTFVAAQLGSEALTLAIFITAFGLGFTASGVVGGTMAYRGE